MRITFRGYVAGPPGHRVVRLPREASTLATNEAESQFLLNLFEEGDHIEGAATLLLDGPKGVWVRLVCISSSPEVQRRLYGHLPDRNAHTWWGRQVLELRYAWYLATCQIQKWRTMRRRKT